MDGRIFHLTKLMLEKLQHNWTIEELAEKIGISAPHLQKLFKTQTGVPPIHHLRHLRLEKARQLLETKFYRLKQIGFEVGMPGDSHFTRDFKSKYGVTPTEYRKRHWEKKQIEKADNRE